MTRAAPINGEAGRPDYSLSWNEYRFFKKGCRRGSLSGDNTCSRIRRGRFIAISIGVSTAIRQSASIGSSLTVLRLNQKTRRTAAMVQELRKTRLATGKRTIPPRTLRFTARQAFGPISQRSGSLERSPQWCGPAAGASRTYDGPWEGPMQTNRDMSI